MTFATHYVSNILYSIMAMWLYCGDHAKLQKNNSPAIPPPCTGKIMQARDFQLMGFKNNTASPLGDKGMFPNCCRDRGRKDIQA